MEGKKEEPRAFSSAHIFCQFCEFKPVMPVPSEKQHQIILIFLFIFGTGFSQEARAVPVPACSSTGSKNKSLCRSAAVAGDQGEAA